MIQRSGVRGSWSALRGPLRGARGGWGGCARNPAGSQAPENNGGRSRELHQPLQTAPCAALPETRRLQRSREGRKPPARARPVVRPALGAKKGGCRFELRTTPSSETARRRRWSGATARSTGCACPASTAAPAFAALLGDPEHGRWLIAPAQGRVQIDRRYAGDTLILETVFTTADGSVSLTDFMYRRDGSSELVRIVRGLAGEVAMRTELVVRFDYGAGSFPGCPSRRTGVSSSSRAPTGCCSTPRFRPAAKAFGPSAISRCATGEEASFVLNWSPSFRGVLPGFGGGARGGAQPGPFVLDRLGRGFQAGGAEWQRRCCARCSP